MYDLFFRNQLDRTLTHSRVNSADATDLQALEYDLRVTLRFIMPIVI